MPAAYSKPCQISKVMRYSNNSLFKYVQASSGTFFNIQEFSGILNAVQIYSGIIKAH